MTRFDKIGDAQFRVMCGMWGVERAIEAANAFGLNPTQEQIDAMRAKEDALLEKLDAIMKGMLKNDGERQGI